MFVPGVAMRRSVLRACSSCWARASRRAKTSRERAGSWVGATRNVERGTRNESSGSQFRVPTSAFRVGHAAATAPATIKNSRRSIVLAPLGGGAYITPPPVPQEGDVRMSFETRIEPLDGKLPKVSYRWDPETDILSVACKAVAKASGLNGTGDLEGADGASVLPDVAGGPLAGAELASRPRDRDI